MTNENDNLPTVLIVDDVPTNVKILADALRAEYRIKVATNGPDALRAAQSQPIPDLVLLDVMMPAMDGYEVCRELKRAPETQRIPVVFVTAKDTDFDEEFGFGLGATDYICKPYSLLVVRARVRNQVQLKKYADWLEELSHVDALTKIPNRRQFNEKLEMEWRRAVREKSALSVLMIDIDYFKQYNDNYGHGAGDEALRRVATSLAGTALRPADLVARYGGEEFIVILPGTCVEAAAQLGDRMRESVTSLAIPHAFSGCGTTLSISIGCASTVPVDESSTADLLHLADQMLYRSKENGRNRVTSATL